MFCMTSYEFFQHVPPFITAKKAKVVPGLEPGLFEGLDVRHQNQT